MEDWEEEIDTLCNELEKIGGNFQCCDRYYNYDTLDGSDTYIKFTICYLGEEAFRVSLEGGNCRGIYENRNRLCELHSKIIKVLKFWKVNRAIKEIERDFEYETENDNK